VVWQAILSGVPACTELRRKAVMNSLTNATTDTESQSGLFPVTHWSLLAQGSSETERDAALEELCRKYWNPVYIFVRRRGLDHHQAEDLTQGFFAFIIEKQILRKADRLKGKFRTFLLAALTSFLANDWNRQHALKRGGHRQIHSIDETTAEGLIGQLPSAALDPEKLFDRRWAMSLLENALERLKAHHARAGKADLFAKLEPGLTGAPSPGWYLEAASALGMTENAVRVALHRLRRQFGETLREEVAQTVESADAVDEEIRHLFAAISS
jgi:RNA polymerase sigma-70 factor (ECF subfamily)